MRFTPETIAFIEAIDANDGRASMREIRNRTDLTSGQRQHQFRKLEDAGYIEVEYTDWGSSSTAPMKVAVLTEEAVEAKKAGWYQSRAEKVRDRTNVDVADLAVSVDELEDRVEMTQTYVSERLYDKLEALERRVDELEAASG
ncbi:hypothetical protein JCM30237_06130 [Halolamina litorea]|uniref:Winged helix DNA-binding domain-containing protein n=1 Tax=Halolamina litorea TaxID=1515593 RepID=A0ABD6BPI1_9EURY|nr:hypothetical protein [Halolamina litorea]